MMDFSILSIGYLNCKLREEINIYYFLTILGGVRLTQVRLLIDNY